MADSPTQRTLRHMRKQGYTCAITERWNPHVKIRQDLFGFIDVICLGENEVVAVQCTSDSNMSKRVRKIEDDESIAEHVAAVRAAGIRIVVQGWKKVKNRWQVREVDLS